MKHLYKYHATIKNKVEEQPLKTCANGFHI